jgi:hypothetical protein
MRGAPFRAWGRSAERPRFSRWMGHLAAVGFDCVEPGFALGPAHGTRQSAKIRVRSTEPSNRS